MCLIQAISAFTTSLTEPFDWFIITARISSFTYYTFRRALNYFTIPIHSWKQSHTSCRCLGEFLSNLRGFGQRICFSVVDNKSNSELYKKFILGSNVWILECHEEQSYI